MLGAAGRESQVVQLLQRETEGNPFFLVETVRVLAEEAGQLDRIGELALPVKVFARGIQEIVQWRLARLPAAAQPLLQVAAVTGRELDLKLLQSIDAKTDLEAWLRICAEAAVLEIGGTIWRFAHDKLREHILDELPADRRTQLHKQVAEALESLYPDAPRYITALAYHWVAAGDADKELAYAEAAAHQAAQNSANEEAIRFFNRALELLLAQPETAGRARRELAMLIGLGPPLMTARGFGASEVAYTYDRAQELAAQTGQSDMLFHATWGQWKHYTQVNDANTSQRLLERLFQLAEQFEDDGFLLEAHHSGWITKSVYNDAAAALEHAKKGIAIYQPEVHQNHIQLYGHDPGVCALCYSALSLWKLGYPDQAYHQVTKGFELGEEIGHPFSLEVGRWGMYWVYYLRGELAEASEKVQEAIQFAGEHGFPQLFASALLVQGAILVRNGKGEEGFKKIREGEKLRERIGSIPEIHPEFLEACLAIGAIEEGLRAGEQEQKAHSFTGKRWVDPEVPRLYGELTLAQDPCRASEAEAQFQLAIEIAQRRSVKSLELRAVMSLARLWQKQGRAAEAYKRLSEVYNWFTEGFDTADLQEAKALLGELG